MTTRKILLGAVRVAAVTLAGLIGARSAAAPVWQFEDFMKAVSAGGALRVQAILASAPSFATKKDHLGRTALHKAATRDVAIVLIDAQADVNAPGGFGQTPLWEAASDGRRGVVEALLAAHADPNLAARDGTTPLHRAAMFNESEIALLLIGAEAHLDAKEEQGRTPLAVAARSCKKIVVQILVTAGADKGAKDTEGRSPLDLAGRCSQSEGRDAILSLLQSAPPAPAP